jgi:propionyl-CoA carboxylase alpha chain
MINVAQGKPLSVTQDQINIKGHALESRVYAEDPYRGFLPSIGHLLKYREPKLENIRIDTGVREGDEISMYYDPLISKTITWGKDRPEAIELMKKALDTYVIRGLGHNVSFCRDVLRQPKFVEGDYTTKFIAETYPTGLLRE